jgi:hypothetical protein
MIGSLAACSGDTASTDATDSPSGGPQVVTTTSPPAPTTPTTPTTLGAEPTLAPAPTAPSSTSPTVGDPVVALAEVGRFDSPIGLAARPGDPTGLYVIEQAGRIVRHDPGTQESTVVAEIVDRVRSGGERGLLGLAFSLDGALAYLDYTDRSGDTIVAEYPVGADGTFGVDS